MNTAVQYLQVKPERRPLAQVELLVLFSPALQSGGPQPIKGTVPVNCTQSWVTAGVFGNPGKSELTGDPILENLRIESEGRDLEPLLSDEQVRAIERYTLGVM